MTKAIGHSENKIFSQSLLFENEVGHGVLQSSFQHTHPTHECQRHRAQSTRDVFILL